MTTVKCKKESKSNIGFDFTSYIDNELVQTHRKYREWAEGGMDIVSRTKGKGIGKLI